MINNNNFSNDTLANRWKERVTYSNKNVTYYVKDNSNSNSNNVMYMKSIRYPTPPITPPYAERKEMMTTGNCLTDTVAFPEDDNMNSMLDMNPLRTQTVIMKIGNVITTNSNDEKIKDIEMQQSENDEERALPSDQEAKGSIVIDAGQNNPNKIANNAGEKFICEWIECSRLFNSLDSLASHVTQAHAIVSRTDGLYYCRWMGCQRIGRGFNARYKMLVHMRTHTKEKPHQCTLCEKRFSRAENLKIHIRSHSGEKPYLCTFEGCTKAYSNSSDRFKHTRTHSIEKPYVCKVKGCQKRYTDPSSLRKHVKTFKHSLQLIKDFPNQNNAGQTQETAMEMAATILEEGNESFSGHRQEIGNEKDIYENEEREEVSMSEEEQRTSIGDLELPQQQQQQPGICYTYGTEFEGTHTLEKSPVHYSNERIQSPLENLQDSEQIHSYENICITSTEAPAVMTPNICPVVPQRDTFCMALEELCQLDEEHAFMMANPLTTAKPILHHPEQEKHYRIEQRLNGASVRNLRINWQCDSDEDGTHNSLRFPLFPAPIYDERSYESVQEFRSPAVTSNAILLPTCAARESLFDAALAWEPLDLRVNRI